MQPFQSSILLCAASGIIVAFIGPVIGGAIGAGTGWLFYWLQRRRIAKDEFCAVVAEQRAKLIATKRADKRSRPESEDVFYRESLDALTAAVYKVRSFINKRQWHRLDALRQEYENHQEQWTGLTRLGQEATTSATYEQRLHAFLDRFEACIS